MGARRSRILRRLWCGCLVTLMAMPVFASPEYLQWLEQQRQPFALSENQLNWTLPPTGIFSVNAGVSRPTLQTHTNVHERIDAPVHAISPPDYQPPILATQYRAAFLSYFGVTALIHIPAAFDQYWSDKTAVKTPLSGRQRYATLSVARQLNAVRQQYQWSHWDLIRLIEKLSLELQPGQSPALMQWAILSALHLDVALGRHQGVWVLLFNSKQHLLGLPSVDTARGRYYIDQGTGIATDSALQVWQSAENNDSRVNIAPSPNAYYGSDWRMISVGGSVSNLSIPVEYSRTQAVATLPVFTNRDYLGLQWPPYLEAIYSVAAGKTAKNEPNIDLHDRLVRFVDQYFADSGDNDVALLAVPTSMPVPLNMSSLRSYLLNKLLQSNGYQQVIAIESGDTLTLAIRADVDSNKTTPIFGAPYQLLGIGDLSAAVHVREDTLGLTKDRIYGVR